MNEWKVAAIFSDHMVLQRDKNIDFFGTCPVGATVTVSLMFEDNIIESVSSKTSDNYFLVTLPPYPAATDLTVSITGYLDDKKEFEKRFTDVAIGEVWLAGGQSNMEFELRNCIGGQELLQNDNNPCIRFYYTQKKTEMDDAFFESEANTSWSLFGPESAQAWSAVGYMYAKKLFNELHVPIGIIGCNWGGTSATSWISKERIVRDEEFKTYYEEYDRESEGKSLEQQKHEYEEYEAYHNEWYRKSEEFYATHPGGTYEECQEICGLCKWPGPKNYFNPYRPSAMYESMIKRVAPYTLRGFIYYQGESDDHKPHTYYRLFRELISQWREDWKDTSLPFIFVQLPMHRYAPDPDYKHWCYIREAQMQIFETIKNTGIAVALDCGVFNDIHPKDKREVANRLALQALCSVYSACDEKDAFGPMLLRREERGGSTLLFFKYAENGIEARGPVELHVSYKQKTNDPKAYDMDEDFVPADFDIKDDLIIIKNPDGKIPSYIRYCWTNYGDVGLYGKNGIPVAPFRC